MLHSWWWCRVKCREDTTTTTLTPKTKAHQRGETWWRCPACLTDWRRAASHSDPHIYTLKTTKVLNFISAKFHIGKDSYWKRIIQLFIVGVFLPLKQTFCQTNFISANILKAFNFKQFSFAKHLKDFDSYNQRECSNIHVLGWSTNGKLNLNFLWMQHSYLHVRNMKW